jgi:hypothetical protein
MCGYKLAEFLDNEVFWAIHVVVKEYCCADSGVEQAI